MQKLIYVTLLLLVSASATTLAQKAGQRPKAVLIPNDIYLTTVLTQPGCPLRIEKAVMAKLLDGTRRSYYEARNTGSKSITFFQIDAVQSDGSGFTAIWPYNKSQEGLRPGQVAPSNINDGSVEFLPLTHELKTKLGLNTGKIKAIVFFIIVKIEFADGTTYDATPLVESLEDHLKIFRDEYEKANRKSRTGVVLPRS